MLFVILPQNDLAETEAAASEISAALPSEEDREIAEKMAEEASNLKEQREALLEAGDQEAVEEVKDKLQEKISEIQKENERRKEAYAARKASSRQSALPL